MVVHQEVQDQGEQDQEDLQDQLTQDKNRDNARI